MSDNTAAAVEPQDFEGGSDKANLDAAFAEQQRAWEGGRGGADAPPPRRREDAVAQHANDSAPSMESQRAEIWPITIGEKFGKELEGLGREKQLKRVSEEMSTLRRDGEAAALIAKDSDERQGLTSWQDHLNRRAKMDDPNIVASYLTPGRPDSNEVKTFIQTGTLPPEKVRYADKHGNIMPDLDDSERIEYKSQAIGPESPIAAAREAARGKMRIEQMRQAAQAERERLAAELGVAEQRTTTEQPQPQPQAEQPQQPQQPQQPDPLARERAELAREHAAARALRESAAMTAQEVNFRRAIDGWNSWARGQGLPSNDQELNAVVQRAQAGDELAKQKLDNFSKYVNGITTNGKEVQRLSSERVTQQTQIAQRNAAAQYANYQKQAAVEDAGFHQRLAAELPEFATPEGLKTLNSEALKTLKHMGLTDQQIQEGWHRTGTLRSTAAQMMVAYATAQRIGREKVLELASKRAPVPPVVRPGARTAAAAAGQPEVDRGDIQRLERALVGATGRRALELGAQLTRAKRAAGQL